MPLLRNKYDIVDLDISMILITLRRYWYWLLIAVFVTMTFGFIYLRYTKRVYQSSAIIQIQDENQGSEILDLGDTKAKRTLSTNVEFLKSPMLFAKALEKLPLGMTFYNKGSILSSQLYNGQKKYDSLSIFNPSIFGTTINLRAEEKGYEIVYTCNGKDYKFPVVFNKKIVTPHFSMVLRNHDDLLSVLKSNSVYFVINDINRLTSEMISSVTITPLNQEAQTIEISYQSNNAVLSRDLVESLVDRFFIYDELVKKQGADNVINFLNSQLDSLSTQLRKSRDSIIFFQQKNKINDPNTAGDRLVQRVSDVEDQLFKVNDDLKELQHISRKINTATTSALLEDVLIQIMNEDYTEALSGQIAELQQLYESKEKLLNKVQRDNPEITIYNNRIKRKVEEIKKSILFVVQKTQRIYNDLLIRRDELEAEYLSIPEKKIEFSKLTSTEELYDKYYSMLMDKKAQYAITNAGYQPGGRILQAASLNNTPVSPRSILIYILCTIVGLILGGIALFIKVLMHNKIESAEDVRRLLGERVNILGELPQMEMNSEFSQIKIEKNSNTQVGELLRGIRANLNFVKPGYKTISITSTVPGEGKTFVALNLATVIAMSGLKTIIVDLDLRKPKIHFAFDLTNTSGVSNFLAGQTELQAIIKNTKYENLDLLTSGTVPPNPSELFLSKQFDILLEELEKQYDVIIMDTPPVGIVTDGLRILSKVEVPIYVFRADYSKKEFTKKTKEILSLLKMRSVNVIVNGIDLRHNSVYGAYKGYQTDSYYVDD